MKVQSLAFLAPILFTNMALACPDLRGVYLCKQNSYHTDTLYAFAQNEVAGVWTFQMEVTRPDNSLLSKFEFRADDIERSVTDAVTGVTLLMKSSCKANELHVQGTSKTPSGEVLRFGEILSITANGDLSNTSLDKDGVTVQETCERQ